MHQTAKDIMETSFEVLRPDQELIEAARVFLERDLSAAPVLDHRQRLVGILSEKDCMLLAIDRAFGTNPRPQAHVADLMRPDVVAVRPETSANELATIFYREQFHQLPVVDGARMVGMVRRRAVFRLIQQVLASQPRAITAQASLITHDTQDLIGPASNEAFRRAVENLS